MILNFKEVFNYNNSNNNNNNSVNIENNYFDLYCGAIIENDCCYRDYPIFDENIEEVITPTKTNLQQFYQIQDFQKIAGKKIKYIIPRNSLLENSAIVISNNNIVDKTKSYANFYNPIVAYDSLKDLEFIGDINIITKNPKQYTEEDNLFISICSSNINNKFCNNTDIENFDSSLLNANTNQLKTWKELFVNYSANLVYDVLFIVLYKDNGKYKIKELFKIDKRLTEFESKYLYIKLNSYNVDLSNTNINNNRFENISANSKAYNTIAESDIIRAINILEDDETVISLMSFEYNNSIDLVNFISDKIVFNSLYDAKRYIKNDDSEVYQNIIDDFLAENEYFSLCLSRKDCINTLNMYLKKCEYINSYVYVNCNGINAGLIFSNSANLINIIDYDSFSVNEKYLTLLFYPTEKQRNYIYDNNCNTLFRKNKIIYINTNKITNNKSTQTIINQNIICKIMIKMLAEIKAKYKVTEKNFYIVIKKIYLDIENMFKLFYKQITATTLQMIRDDVNSENNLIITIYFNDFIEEFEVNLKLEEI